MEVVFSQKFHRELNRLLKKHPEYVVLVQNRIKLLRNSPTHPSLRLHKLTNRDEYAISVDHSIRILFSREKDECFLLTIGTHDEVY